MRPCAPTWMADGTLPIFAICAPALYGLVGCGRLPPCTLYESSMCSVYLHLMHGSGVMASSAINVPWASADQCVRCVVCCGICWSRSGTQTVQGAGDCACGPRYGTPTEAAQATTEAERRSRNTRHSVISVLCPSVDLSHGLAGCLLPAWGTRGLSGCLAVWLSSCLRGDCGASLRPRLRSVAKLWRGDQERSTY